MADRKTLSELRMLTKTLPTSNPIRNSSPDSHTDKQKMPTTTSPMKYIKPNKKDGLDSKGKADEPIYSESDMKDTMAKFYNKINALEKENESLKQNRVSSTSQPEYDDKKPSYYDLQRENEELKKIIAKLKADNKRLLELLEKS